MSLEMFIASATDEVLRWHYVTRCIKGSIFDIAYDFKALSFNPQLKLTQLQFNTSILSKDDFNLSGLELNVDQIY